MNDESSAPKPVSPPPKTSADEMSPEELAEAKQYGRTGLACDLVDRAIDLVYLGVMAFVVARPLDAWLQTCPVLTEYWTLRLTVLFLIVFTGHMAVSFGLSFYSGHVVEHRFKLSNLSLGAWLWRYVKRMALAAVFGLLMFVGLFWLIWTTGPFWWPLAALAFFLVSIILGRIMPVLILPLFYKTEKLDYPEFLERMSRLTEGTGLAIEGVYRLDLSEETSKANAMLAGSGSTRRVLLGDTLLEQCDLDELEVIFAHEVGHHVFHHLHKIVFAGLIFSAVGFYFCDRIVQLWTYGDAGPLYTELPVYTLPMFMFLLTVISNLLEPINNAISRHYERQSDRYALERTGLAGAFISAFRKLSRLNKDNPDPPWLETVLFHSHPPIARRVAMAEAFKKS